MAKTVCVLRRLLSIVVISASLGGCGSVSSIVGAVIGKPPEVKVPPPPPPKVAVVPKRVIEVDLQADPQVNPTAAGSPAPVVMRVYLLKADVGFRSADFFSLFEKDQSALGGDLLLREEVQLRPGERVSISRELVPEARFVAVFGAFRDLERSRWRSILALPAAPGPTTDPPEKPIPVPVLVRAAGRDVVVSAAP